MVKTKDAINQTIKKTLAYLSKRITITEAVLFGSYAQGNPHEYSDIDLAIFSPEVEKLNLEDKAKLFSEVRRRCGQDIEVHFFSEKMLREARPTNFCGYILATGKRVR